jgi:hypothetical protein
MSESRYHEDKTVKSFVFEISRNNWSSSFLFRNESLQTLSYTTAYFFSVNDTVLVAVRSIGQDKARYRKYKRLKLRGGQAHDGSSVKLPL